MTVSCTQVEIGSVFSRTVTFSNNGAPLAIAPTADVRAVVVNQYHTESFGEPVAQSSDSPQADWANGVVEVVFDVAYTSALRMPREDERNWLEVQVLPSPTDTPTTAYIPVQIVRSFIPQVAR